MHSSPEEDPENTGRELAKRDGQAERKEMRWVLIAWHIVGAPKWLVFFPKKEQLEKSEMEQQGELRWGVCRTIVWQTVGAQ